MESFNLSNTEILDASSGGPFPALQRAADLRPELKTLAIARTGRDNTGMFEGFLMAMQQTKPLYYRLVLCNVSKGDGNELYKQNKFREARAKYVEAAKKILGQGFVFPADPKAVRIKEYMGLVWQEMMDVVACFNNMAQCYIREGNLEEALEWLQEVAVVYMNQSFTQRTPLFCWKNTNLLIEEYYLNQQKYHLRLSQSFLSLLNTSCAVHHSWAVASISGSIATATKPPRITKMLDDANVMKFAEYRHPDIKLPGRLSVTYPALQIRGKWERLVIKGGARPPQPRLGMATWVWRGKLYVAGGQSAMQDRVRDMWVMKFSDDPEERRWQRLPDIPPRAQGGPQENSTAGILMKVWKDSAYLFFGSKNILAFNLVTEVWEKKQATFSRQWPYVRNDLSEYAMEIYDGNMYIFGGQDGRMQLGCNLFMALDLTTFAWEWISGSSEPLATHDCPMLRVHPETWVLPSESTLFVMYGNANRMGEGLSTRSQSIHGADSDYTYEDIWAYHIPTRTWTREKTRGNYPCPRTEFSTIYNPYLDRTIAFGGYCGTTNTYFPDRGLNFTFAYYADTYLWNPKDRKWSQVLTRGFPTYRAQARLLIDEDSGKTYLFGGYTNSDFVPSKHVVSRAFNDVWQLKIDFPDGRGGIVDRERELGEEEERTAVMGPWGTCYCCGAVGQWRMCGGSCGGVVRYCSNECGREAWGEHKRVHGCRVKEGRGGKG